MPLDLSLVGTPTAPSSFTYTWKEAVLYALGVGAKQGELDYLFEGRGPKVLPSFAMVPKFPPLLEIMGRSGGNVAMVVHGGERLVMKKPFPPAATLTTTARIRAIYDMRRFAQVIIDADSRDASGDAICTTTSSILFRGEGGFGGEPPPKDDAAPSTPKDRPADFQVEEPTSPEQALLYRLSGDPNPLHADPEFAKSVGFEKGPILHGLCTFGHMVRHFAKGALGGDAARIASVDGQFKRPVWPGDTLVTQGWDVGGGKWALVVKVKERDEVVLGGAWGSVVA